MYISYIFMCFVFSELAARKPEERQELCERLTYDDEFTFRLVQEASKLCGEKEPVWSFVSWKSWFTQGISGADLLEEFGEQFFIWCREYGYDQTLRSLGSSIRDFLSNLDTLHDHLETSMFPGMKAPSFRCSDGPNGEIYLHYYSGRRGLEHIVIGIIKTLYRQLHNTVAEVKVVQEVDDINDHVVFAINTLGAVNRKRRHTVLKPDLSFIGEDRCFQIPTAQFCETFPFHIVFDNHKRILQMGTSLFRVLTGHNIATHVGLHELFEVERPHGLTF